MPAERRAPFRHPSVRSRSDGSRVDDNPRARYILTLSPFDRAPLPAFGRLVAIATACAVLTAAAPFPPSPDAAASSPMEVRALWVTRATLVSPAAVADMVRAAARGGFNALLVQVRGRGDAYYKSSIEPRAAELAGQPGFDPLAATVTLARAAGIQVHAWIAVNLVSSAVTLPSDRTHVAYRHPEWLMVPRALAAELGRLDARSPAYLGKLARWSRAHADEVEGLYTSPIPAAAAAHVAAVVREVTERYALDGVHLDYVRYPDDQFDFSRAALAEFRQVMRTELAPRDLHAVESRLAVDPLAYPTLYRERWEAFRRSRLTSLVMRVRTAVKAARPTAVVSAAVVPDAEEAARFKAQDWRTWLDQSLIDVLCPMAYAPDTRLFEQQIHAAHEFAGSRPVWAGIGAYRLSATETVQRIAATRRLGLPGVILFSYDALVAPPNTSSTLTDLGKAAFGGGS
jgi:uncharacterized lipoprotein YddW (UPF0748 family)